VLPYDEPDQLRAGASKTILATLGVEQLTVVNLAGWKWTNRRNLMPGFG